MATPTSGPQVALRSEVRLAAVRDTVDRARHAAAVGTEPTALLEVTDTGLSAAVRRVAGPVAAVARFGSEDLHPDLGPARQEVHGSVEVRFAVSEPDQGVFRG